MDEHSVYFENLTYFSLTNVNLNQIYCSKSKITAHRGQRKREGQEEG